MLGIYTRIRKVVTKTVDYTRFQYYLNKRGSGQFKFESKKFKYFIHPYNFTWRNERIVEIPIFVNLLSANRGKKILELGNVLQHYLSINHDILDKYEKGEKVINKDIVSYKSKKKYDLIISISTLEHIGWDEKDNNPEKIFKAVSSLKEMLNSGGKLVFSIPLGYNYILDQYITSGKLKLKKTYLLQRISEDNLWRQVRWRKQRLRYHYPYEYANGLLIGVITK